MKNYHRTNMSPESFAERCSILMCALDFGEENAFTQREITARTGFSKTETRLMLEDMRRKDVVVCSSNKGYFYPESIAELERYILRLSRYPNSSTALDPAKKKLGKWREKNLR